jgi:hypothetical protein
MKPFARDPFSLMGFHRLLIGTAIAACLFFGAWALYHNESDNTLGAVLTAAISWLLAIGLTVYLVRIRGKK